MIIKGGKSSIIPADYELIYDVVWRLGLTEYNDIIGTLEIEINI